MAETREARKKKAEKEVIERNAAPSERNDRHLSKWVQPWITSTYIKQEQTLESYSLAWKWLLEFFTLKGIRTAEQIRREHCHEYLNWRQGIENGVKIREGAGRNTAIHDLVILRKILNEAVAMTWIVTNPAAKLGLKKDAPHQKQEFSDVQLAIIWRKLPTLPEWAQISWRIAWAQGCRLAETSFPLRDVDFKNNTVTLTLKGGKRHTTALNPTIKLLLQNLKRKKKTVTWNFTRNASRDWSRIFKNLGIEGMTFHSTRVSAITRLARAGINEQQTMRFIGHSSEQVHAIYQRLKASDLTACTDALKS